MRKLVLFSALLIAGCASRPPVRPPIAPPPPVVATEPPLLSPADYLAVSVSRSLLLVRASELVAQRLEARSAMAAGIAEIHRGIAAQLNLAGRRLNLLPSARLLPADAARLAALARSDQLDLDYLGLVRVALRECVRHEADYGRRGTSPTLRPVARFAQGACERSRPTFR